MIATPWAVYERGHALVVSRYHGNAGLVAIFIGRAEAYDYVRRERERMSRERGMG